MRKNETDISRTIEALGLDDDHLLAVAGYVEERKVVRKLASARAARNMTQAEVGKRIGRSQRHVSWIESAPDRKVRLADLCGYGEAVGVKIEISLS